MERVARAENIGLKVKVHSVTSDIGTGPVRVKQAPQASDKIWRPIDKNIFFVWYNSKIVTYIQGDPF